MEILIVDDEEEILTMLKRYLEMEGYEVTTSPNPLEAVELMKKHLYNLVITDIRMPGMTGIELLKTLREINPLTNVYIITGYSNMSYVVECLARGAYDYFTKPFADMDGLLKSISEGKERIQRWKSAIKMGGQFDKTRAHI